jgi:hypothetical protein
VKISSVLSGGVAILEICDYSSRISNIFKIKHLEGDMKVEEDSDIHGFTQPCAMTKEVYDHPSVIFKYLVRNLNGA